MILSTLLSLPAHTVDWQFLTVTEAFPSPFTGDEQVASMPLSARWAAVLTWKLLSRSEAADLEAFLVECNGRAGRFYLTNQARSTPRGSAPGAAVVDGAGSYGGVLATRGWTPSRANILRRGDFFAVNNEIKVIRNDVASDAAGCASLVFAPSLRNVPLDGAPIVTTAPAGIFRLLDDGQAKFAYRKQTGDYQVSCVETWS